MGLFLQENAIQTDVLSVQTENKGNKIDLNVTKLQNKTVDVRLKEVDRKKD